MAKKEKEHWKLRPVTIKFKDLNPVLQEIIGKHGIKELAKGPFHSIRGDRTMRGIVEGLTVIALAATLAYSREGKKVAFPAVGIAALVGMRVMAAREIQAKHRVLAEIMDRSGILRNSNSSRKKYPRDQVNLTILEKTHPIFYVKRNGDLVFLRNSRWEYARYLFQKKWMGKLGLNLWRWRAYLKPPEARKKEGDWIARKVAEWARKARARRKLVPRPARVPARRNATRSVGREFAAKHRR